MSAAIGDGKESEASTSSSVEWSEACRPFELSEIQLATKNFDESLVIGSGGFGKVYKGSVIDGSGVMVVAAIKRLDCMSNQGADEFWAEVKLLSKLSHSNLVSLIGYCYNEGEMILVYEYMPNGTLEDHLHKLHTPLSWIQRLCICIDAGRGLHYLHTGTGLGSGVVHRDVKTSNILVDETWAAKVSDFGLSRIGRKNQPSTYINTRVKGTHGYLDLDYVQTGRLTRKSAVYAFGVVLLEVLCRKRAVDFTLVDGEWTNLAEWAQESIKNGNLKQIIDSDIRDEMSAKCMMKFVEFTERCLQLNPKKRPTMADVVASLESVLTLQEKMNMSLQGSGGTILGKMRDMISFSSNGVNSGGVCEREPPAIKKSKTEKTSKSSEGQRGGRVDLNHPQIINVQNYSIFSATWNVGGKSPSSNMNLDDWLHAAPPADIYVLGFQEIVPLNAANILGAENNVAAKNWLSLIRKTLNYNPESSVCYTPSPVSDPVAEYDADFEGSTRHQYSFFFNRRSFQASKSSTNEKESQFDRRYSVCDRAILGQIPSDSSSSHRLSDYSASYRPSPDYSRGGSSDDDYGHMEDLATNNSFPPISNWGSNNMEDGHSSYCLVASKQMVGVFLTVWVKSELKEHVRNMKVSCVGRGLMGYLGNKGSVSVSMLLHQTSFCFVCSHFTSGQKEGDELRRNSDFMEIIKKTRFPSAQGFKDDKSPETILEHDRIIWLGDLNYRIALSYRSTKALVEMQNWRALLEKDQLQIEQRRGRAFQGWNEGKIYFPPTCKYLTNSDRYVGDNLQHKEKQRTPAWCDRILWYGSGLQQLSYVRGESRFLDHRPVYSLFWAEVELNHTHYRRTMSCLTSRIQVEELLPYTNGYTGLFF